MVGNSPRSDIAPVLALGGWAVHVPYPLTWAHEEDVDEAWLLAHPRYRSIATLDELPALLAELDGEGGNA
jgi:putative hydrolase of the HAD superfamily